MESLRMALENRAASLTPGSSQAEVINVLGPLNTVNRIKKQQLQSLATSQPNSALLEDSKINLDGINLKINTGSVSAD
jgi:hypothetical protein